MRLDYCIVAFAIILSISIFQWIVDGRKNFTGPRVNLVSDNQPSDYHTKSEEKEKVEHRP
jgi:hypothetical protein